jgi:hypothetical protein
MGAAPPRDYLPRISPAGFLLEEVDEGYCHAASWVGISRPGTVKVRGKKFQVTFHEALQLGPSTFRPGEWSYAAPEGPGEPMEIAQIVELYDR